MAFFNVPPIWEKLIAQNIFFLLFPNCLNPFMNISSTRNSADLLFALAELEIAADNIRFYDLSNNHVNKFFLITYRRRVVAKLRCNKAPKDTVSFCLVNWRTNETLPLTFIFVEFRFLEMTRSQMILLCILILNLQFYYCDAQTAYMYGYCNLQGNFGGKKRFHVYRCSNFDYHSSSFQSIGVSNNLQSLN